MINRPNCISHYNENMGGTELQDQCVANYRIGVRGKKWYWPIFTWMVDIAINNAWIIYRKFNKNVSNLDFRREIAQVYLNRYGVKSAGAGRKKVHREPFPDVRYDRKDHFVAPCNRRRCAGAGCVTFGRTQCQKCDVGLCVKCFISYHTK